MAVVGHQVEVVVEVQKTLLDHLTEEEQEALLGHPAEEEALDLGSRWEDGARRRKAAER